MSIQNRTLKPHALLCYIAITISTTLVCLISRHLIANSKLVIDFENLLDFPLQSYFYIGSIIGLAIANFGFHIFLNKKIKQQQLTSGKRLAYFSFASVFALPLLVAYPSTISILWSYLGLTLYNLTTDLFSNPKEKNLTWLIAWMSILSIGLSVVLFDGYLEYDTQNRAQIARELYHEKDTESIVDFYALQEKLKSDGFIAQFLTVPKPFKIHRSEFNEVNNHILDPSGENKYDYILNAFDSEGKSMIYESYTSIAYYDRFISRSDTLDDLTFFNPIKNAYLTSWNVILPADSTVYKVYLEQYPQGSHVNNYENLGKYDFAYFKDGTLNSTSNRYILDPLDEDIQLPVGTSHKVTRENYSDLYVQLNPRSMMKLSRKSTRLIKPVSLFSFIFIYIALLFGLFTGVNSIRPTFPTFLTFSTGKWNTLQHKLQLSIISLILFSFLIIGIVTILYFQNLSTEYDDDISREKAYALKVDLEDYLEIGNLDVLSNDIDQLASKHQSEINVYSHEGDLLASSVPKVFEKGLYKPFLKKEDVRAFAQNPNKISLEQNADFMGLAYQFSYFPVLDALDGNAVIVENLQIPVVKSHSKVADFVGTLLNIYVLLFLLSGALALMVSHNITRPIKQLGTKIKHLKLGGKNEHILWDSTDEIGDLVHNYNDMIDQLEDSAKVIAHTERDLAWREMAKQVAHEIKNPLTPMKLSIQYLQRAIQQNPDHTQELVENVSRTLIEQIDNLSNIAGAFSNFGKMPHTSNEKVILNDVLSAVYDLFRKRNDMDIAMYEPIDDLYVFADRNALIRILNNLVKNAIQAIPTDRQGKIEIKLYKKEKQAVIKITDNGIGIPDDRKEKVFLPNFTTKSSGTGLGLAICANMVEAFNGKLNFVSEEHVGTSFFLEIPLMHVNDNFATQERVVLD